MPDYLSSFLNIIQTLAIVISLLVVAWQTRQLGKQIKFSTISGTSLHLHAINELLLQDEKLAKLIGYNQEDALAAVFFGEFELWYGLHQEHMTDRLHWRSDAATIDDFLKLEFMRRYWERTKHQYPLLFTQYINERLSKLGFEKQTSLEVSQQE